MRPQPSSIPRPITTALALARRLAAWQRRVLFREEEWRLHELASRTAFAQAIAASADDGLPLLLTLPKLPFNRPFVGRVRNGRIAMKHRTHPALWLIGPGSYYFSGHLADGGGGALVAGRYRLRPTLAWMYHVYFAIGVVIVSVSLLAAALGAGLWALIAGADSAVLRNGLEMVAISCAYVALGWGHIGFEKWLDTRNRHAVRRLFSDAMAAPDSRRSEAAQRTPISVQAPKSP